MAWNLGVNEIVQVRRASFLLIFESIRSPVSAACGTMICPTRRRPNGEAITSANSHRWGLV